MQPPEFTLHDKSPHCTTLLICPVCTAELFEAGRTLQCADRHSFDRARSGYVNLLPAGHGRSGIQGDTRPMLAARQRFLERGHFLRLSEHITNMGQAQYAERGESGRFALAEVGSGVGYYIGRLNQQMSAATANSICCFGIDVSKEAVQLASMEYRGVQFVVNDVKHRLCLATGTIDLLLNIFAPRNTQEFARVLRPAGTAVVVVPGADHLRELRKHLSLLRAAPDKVDRTAEQLGSGFRQTGQQELTYRVELASADLLDLLQMTPNYWHLEPDTLRAATALGNITVTMSFAILRFEQR